ncbi:hypothetical protein [Serratia sp. D1N4]
MDKSEDNIHEQRIVPGRLTRVRLSVVGGRESSITVGYDEPDNIIPGEAEMSDMNREELQSHIKASKAEIDVIAASMRLEMAEFRAFQAQQFSAITTSLSEIKGEMIGAKGEINGLREGITGQISGLKDGISGQIDGLKSTASTTQWLVGTILAVIALVAAVAAIPGIEKIL